MSDLPERICIWEADQNDPNSTRGWTVSFPESHPDIYVRASLNTRPAAPVEGLETIGYVHRGTIGLLLEGAVSKAAIAPTSGGDFKHPVVFGEQAEAIIAAERAEKEKLEAAWLNAEGIISDLKAGLAEALRGNRYAQLERIAVQHAEKAEADNAALTARVKEYIEARNAYENAVTQKGAQYVPPLDPAVTRYRQARAALEGKP